MKIVLKRILPRTKILLSNLKKKKHFRGKIYFSWSKDLLYNYLKIGGPNNKNKVVQFPYHQFIIIIISSISSPSQQNPTHQHQRLGRPWPCLPLSPHIAQLNTTLIFSLTLHYPELLLLPPCSKLQLFELSHSRIIITIAQESNALTKLLVVLLTPTPELQSTSPSPMKFSLLMLQILLPTLLKMARPAWRLISRKSRFPWLPFKF